MPPPNPIVCQRCGQKEIPGYRWETVGFANGEQGRYCPGCANLKEYESGGCILPDHPVFTKSGDLLNAACWAHREFRKSPGPDRRLPSAMAALAKAIRAINPELLPKTYAGFEKEPEEEVEEVKA